MESTSGNTTSKSIIFNFVALDVMSVKFCNEVEISTLCLFLFCRGVTTRNALLLVLHDLVVHILLVPPLIPKKFIESNEKSIVVSLLPLMGIKGEHNLFEKLSAMFCRSKTSGLFISIDIF